MLKKRYLTKVIKSDLTQKMVFIGGPRQVGKTTFAKEVIGPTYQHPAYFNWDFRRDRRDLVAAAWPGEADLIILDEIHKYKKWKNLVKGVWDKQGEQFDILVTGSARLDIYRRGGDSLQGRYHYFRLHPFSLAELAGLETQVKPGKALTFSKYSAAAAELKDLLVLGGFPEPLFAKNQKTLRRWHNERLERLVGEDIRDLEVIKDLGSLELLGDMLPSRVASLLSLNSLRRDLEVSFRAVARWVDLLERFYYHFRLYPFMSRKIRSLKKEPKLYLWDWSEVEDESKRLENLVASHLLKTVHYLHDAEGYDTGLYFLRDADGREADFLVTINQQPWFAVEVKTQDLQPSGQLKYFGERLKIPYLYQVVLKPEIDQQVKNVRLISADYFLTGLI